MIRRMVWVGVVLFVLGTTLAVSSYFSMSYWENDSLGWLILTIDPKSSFDAILFLTKTADMKRLVVTIIDFPRSDILNATLNYSWPERPLTITLVGSLGNISQTDDADMFPSTHVFDIPDDWTYVVKTTVSNPGDSPTCLVEQLTLERQLVTDNWRLGMYSGIASGVTGIVLVGTWALLNEGDDRGDWELSAAS